MINISLKTVGRPTIIAGPCSVESSEQMDQVCALIAKLGLKWVRGGAYKPRMSPHSFQGLGVTALEILKNSADKFGLKTITEVVDADQIDQVMNYVDALQIGARNMTNYQLLIKIGQVTAACKMPVLFKRGMSATITEWIAASEYITQYGNDNVMLCERGLRTFEDSTRFTLDISAVPVVHKQSKLPICVDASHAAGQRDLVPSLACAAVAAGADALMIEVHPNPLRALSDGPQQLNLAQFEKLVPKMLQIAQVSDEYTKGAINKHIAADLEDTAC